MGLTNDLAGLYRRKETKKLQTLAEGLIHRKEELDVFFEEYLQLFDERMSATEDQNDPIWKAYTTRYKEWTKLNKDITLANYYLRII